MNPTEDAYTARLDALVGNDDPVAILSGTPDRLRALLTDVADEVRTRRPHPERWSISEILAHLADSEVVFAHRLRMLLSANRSPLTAFDPDTWAATFRYRECPPSESLALFSAIRASDVALIKRMTPDLLHRAGRHEEWGPTTAATLVRLEAGHDRNHLAQIERVLEPGEIA